MFFVRLPQSGRGNYQNVAKQNKAGANEKVRSKALESIGVAQKGCSFAAAKIEDEAEDIY